MSVQVSIVIPTLGHKENLKRLLQSICRQAVDFSRIEVLLIANGQTADEFAKFKEKYENKFELPLTFYHLEAKGVSAARNLGLRQAQGELFYFLDDDCELHLRNTLNYHIDQHLQQADLFALGGGYLLPAQAGLFDEIYNHIQMSWFLNGQAHSESQLKPTQYLLGGNFSAKKKFLHEYAIKFDDSIAYGGSESALFKQAAQAGLKMSTCPVEVTHHTAETASSIARKVYKQGRGQSLINQKYTAEGLQHRTRPQKEIEVEVRFGLWVLFYNYVFWSGYFAAEGKPLKVFDKLTSDLVGRFNQWRYDIIDRLNQKK